MVQPLSGVYIVFFVFLVFLLHHVAYWILVLRPGIEPVPPAVEAQRLSIGLLGKPYIDFN